MRSRSWRRYRRRHAGLIVVLAVVDALWSILTTLPPTPADAQVIAALAGLPKPGVDPTTKLAGIPPRVRSVLHGADVGVSVRGGENDCLLGLRQNGKVTSWYPPHVYVQPGEYGCGPDVAFSLVNKPPPHRGPARTAGSGRRCRRSVARQRDRG
jgi:hypothetical protein